MQLHQLKPIHKLKKRKRIGRGGKRGTYSGRGIKGQKARAGRKLKPIIRELIKRYPKLRGVRMKSFSSKSKRQVIVNLAELEKNFNSGDKITPEILLEKGIISKIKGRIPRVKILSKGKLTKKLIIQNCYFSMTAKRAIEEAGGTVKSETE